MKFFDRQLNILEGQDFDTKQTSFWRKEEPVRNEQGVVVTGGMWSYQREWWDLPNFIKGLIGGLGSGKTNCGGKRIIASALENAPVPVAVVSPTYTMARRTVIQTLQEMLSAKQAFFGTRNFRWRFNKSDHEFRIYYHGREATIYIYSGEDPVVLKGPNLASAWIDEPFIQKYAVFTEMIARVRHPDAVKKELLMTGTPEQLNWGYELFEGELKEHNDVGFVQASTRGNLALTPDYVKRLEGVYSKKAAEAYIDARFVNMAEGMVYYGFKKSKFEEGGNIADLPIPEDGVEWGVGMDFNVNPFAFTVFWRSGNRVHFVAEYELPNADTEYACQTIKEDFPKVRGVYPDPAGKARHTSSPGGKSDHWYLRQYGFDVFARSEAPLRKDRYNAVNGKLDPKSGPITLTISPQCKKLIKYLSLYTHAQMNKDEQKAMSHLLDAFGYPVEYLFPISKEILTARRLMGA